MSQFTLEASNTFFSPVRHPFGDRMALGAPAADPATPGTVFNSSDAGLISVILAQPTVSAEVQKSLDVQRQNLINLTGVASAFVRKQADVKKDPNLVYDTNLWQGVFNHLPLMGPSQFTRQTVNQNIKGIELASTFIANILGVATAGGPALAGFSTFLSGLGSDIRAGMNTDKKKYSFGAIGIVLEGQQVGNEVKINPWLKGYFIDFTESSSKVYSNCGSAESFNMSFEYRYAMSLFNYGALENADVKKNYDAFIAGTQIDDIKTATNFFQGSFDTSSS